MASEFKIEKYIASESKNICIHTKLTFSSYAEIDMDDPRPMKQIGKNHEREIINSLRTFISEYENRQKRERLKKGE